MLPERYTELLAAYVDGEIGTRQRKILLRLLRKSPEARAQLRKLQGDSRDIHLLPRRKLDSAFSLEVMEAIAERGLQPVSRPAVASPRPRLAVWAGWAAAAAILVAVGAASYFAFPLLLNERPKNTLAVKDGNASRPGKTPQRDGTGTTPKRPVKKSVLDKGSIAQGARDKRIVEPLINVDKPDREKKSTDLVAKKKPDPPKKKIEPKPEERDVVAFPTDPDQPQINGQTNVANLSVMMLLQEVEQKEKRAKLLAKLEKDSAFHIPMLCRDTTKGLELLRSVLAANKIEMVIDQSVRQRLKNAKLKTTFVVYAENLKPEELVAIFEQLGQADLKAAKPRSPGQFTDFVVNFMSPKFRQQISKFLGSASQPFSNGKSKAPLGVDNGKSLVEGTGDEVARKVKEREMARAKETGAGKAGFRRVLVLAYNEDKSPVHPRAAHSKEVRQFRESRQERQPGTLQVVLVLQRPIS